MNPMKRRSGRHGIRKSSSGRGTAALFVLAGAIVLASCSNRVSQSVEDLKQMESTGYQGQQVSDKRIAELRQAVKKYRGIVEQKVNAAGQLADYYKLIGKAYLDNGNYGLALEAFDNAIQVQPENAVLFYYAGVSAANQAKADVNDKSNQQSLFEKAANYYKRSIELDPSYTQASYGLAVLDVFELSDPGAAVPLLENMLAIEKSDTDAMFVLARAYVIIGKTEQAAAMYERIANTTGNADVKAQALDNRKQLLENVSNG